MCPSFAQKPPAQTFRTYCIDSILLFTGSLFFSGVFNAIANSLSFTISSNAAPFLVNPSTWIQFSGFCLSDFVYITVIFVSWPLYKCLGQSLTFTVGQQIFVSE